jgi:hypothetical protein
MERMYKKPSIPIPPTLKKMDKMDMTEALLKWLPIICAGSAIGIGVIALKEIKNVKMQMKMTASGGSSDELLKRMEIMEKQLNKISDYVKQPKPVFHAPPPPAQPNPHRQQQVPKQQAPVIVKNVPTPPKEVKIINSEVEEYEYEEIEVTDDEADEADETEM